jgi:hypothetical protein
MSFQKPTYGSELVSRLLVNLSRIGESAFEPLTFQFAQQGHKSAHAAGGAGTGAAMREAAHFLRRASPYGGYKLIHLGPGLIQIKVYQFAQVLRVAISEIMQTLQINGGCFVRRGC